MNTQNLRLAVLVTFALPSLAVAQSTGLAASDAQALVASLPQGAEFRSDGQTYRPVVGLRAELRPAGRVEPGQASAEGTTEVIVEVKGPYVIYRDTATVSAAGKSLVGAPRVAKGSVVVNVRTGQLGIADGIITAKLFDVEAARALAAANGLAVEYVAAHIGYAFFTAPSGRDLAAAAAALRNDPRVKSAHANVQENFGEPG
jgi:hypothetical protein